MKDGATQNVSYAQTIINAYMASSGTELTQLAIDGNTGYQTICDMVNVFKTVSPDDAQDMLLVFKPFDGHMYAFTDNSEFADYVADIPKEFH